MSLSLVGLATKMTPKQNPSKHTKIPINSCNGNKTNWFPEFISDHAFRFHNERSCLTVLISFPVADCFSYLSWELNLEWLVNKSIGGIQKVAKTKDYKSTNCMLVCSCWLSKGATVVVGAYFYLFMSFCRKPSRGSLMGKIMVCEATLIQLTTWMWTLTIFIIEYLEWTIIRGTRFRLASATHALELGQTLIIHLTFSFWTGNRVWPMNV